MEVMEIQVEEYNNLLEAINTMQNNDILKKINNLVDVLSETRHGLFIKDYYDDLTEVAINTGWNDEPSPWDNL